MKKTKKALLAALACSAVLAGAFGLAACNNGGTEGGDDGHKHAWGNWTVANAPTDENPGKATRTCSGKGECDAAASAKEATLPILSKTDYTLSNDTATCQAAGTATYTYNKDGVNVSFTAATPVNPDNHTANCGHGQAAAHAHKWSEWTVSESALLGYAGTATRECTGAGECDADESLTEVTIPSVFWGDKDVYTYAEPVVKTEATCQQHGVYTYTYTDAAKNISVSFDVTESGYGAHKIVGNECEVCHLSAVTATLNEEVTVNATSENATILAFTAEEAGRYKVVYTQSSGASGANINNNTVDFPDKFDLKAGETITYDIKAPELDGSATYKLKFIPVTVLSAEYDEQDNLVGSAKVTVGGGKTATLEVQAKADFDGTIRYDGTNSLTFSWKVYELGSYVEKSFTLSEAEPTHTWHFTLLSLSSTFEYTVSSDAEEAFEAELSYELVESEPEEEDLSIELGEEKELEDIGYDGKIYTLEIVEAGDYVINLRGVDIEYMLMEVRTEADNGETAMQAVDGNYTFAAGTTYYILVSSNKPDTENEGAWLPVSGVMTVTKALPVISLNQSVIGWYESVYVINLEEGKYQVKVNGKAVSIDYFDYADVCFSTIDPTTNGYGEWVGSGKVLTVTAETAGKYYIQLFAGVTFTVEEAEEGGDEDNTLLTTAGGTFDIEWCASALFTLAAKSDENPNGFEVGKTYRLSADDGNVMICNPSDSMGTSSKVITYTEGMVVKVINYGNGDSVNLSVEEVTE